MISDSLLKSAVAGKDGFTWWIGRVAHDRYWRNQNIALLQEGEISQRVKVRIVGYHPWDSTLKENDLPWAQVMMSGITGSGQAMIGDTLCLAGGETCIGFFLDGDEAQQPVIMGLLHRHANAMNNISDEEIDSQDSNNFKTFSGHHNGEVKATKRRSTFTEPIQKPKSPSVTGKVNNNVENKNQGAGCSIDNSAAQLAACKEADVEYKRASSCDDDAISHLSGTIQNFMTFANGLEEAGGKYIDPVLNKIIDMDAELKKTARMVGSISQGIVNNVRKGLNAKADKLFRKFNADQAKKDPFNFLNSSKALKATSGISGLLYCVFDDIMNQVTGFITNMLKNLLGKLINGPLCAVEQFVSGLLAKIMGTIEGLTGPILKGIGWLTGGLANIGKVLGNVSNLAKKIVNFLNKCDKTPCDNPVPWRASTGAKGKSKSGGLKGALDGVNVFKGIQNQLGDVQKYLGKDKLAKIIAGGDLTELKGVKVGGSDIVGILQATDVLTGGNSAGWLDGGLGSLESAIATSSIFGNPNSIFNACDPNNTNTQDDLIGMPPGFKYEKCIPPKVEVTGHGAGAKLLPVVSTDGRIFSIEVEDGGVDYDVDTTVSVIDNTNHGSAAIAEPIVENGSIAGVVVLSSGSGYCSGKADPVGVVTSVHPVRPGLGYTDGDTITISDPITSDTDTGTGVGSTVAPVIVTPNGSIIEVKIPTNFNHEFSSIPNLRINTKTGYGAEFVPVMKDIQQSVVDDVVRPLVGITSVIDCV